MSPAPVPPDGEPRLDDAAWQAATDAIVESPIIPRGVEPYVGWASDLAELTIRAYLAAGRAAATPDPPTDERRPWPIAPDTVMPPRRQPVRWGSRADDPPTEIHDDPGKTKAYLAGLAAGRTEAAAASPDPPDEDAIRADERERLSARVYENGWCPTCAHKADPDAMPPHEVAAILVDPAEVLSPEEVAEYERCQQSVIDARRRAPMVEGQMIVGAAASPDERLREALRTMIDVYDRHDRWCGHYAQAPGDGIIHRIDGARNALAAADREKPDEDQT